MKISPVLAVLAHGLGLSALLALGALVLPPFYVRVGQLIALFRGPCRRLDGSCASRAMRAVGHGRLHRRRATSPAGLVEARFFRRRAALAAAARLAVGRAVRARAVGGDLLPDPAPASHLLRHRHAWASAHVCAELNNNVHFFEDRSASTFRPSAKNVEPADLLYWLYLLAGLLVLLIAWQIRRSRLRRRPFEHPRGRGHCAHAGRADGALQARWPVRHQPVLNRRSSA